MRTGAVTHEQVMIDVSYRVIADHVRCLTFALTDGAVPSNEGRGYVLRRILRRAVRYGRQYFDVHEPFLCDLVEPLVAHMADAFPELRTAHGGKNVAHVTELIRDEEASFIKTLDRGIKLFNEAANHARKHHHGKISGEDAFKLHDTYGFPVDLTELMAEEQGLTIDIGEYERLMEDARERARKKRDIVEFSPGFADQYPQIQTDDSAKYRQLEVRTKGGIVGCRHPDLPDHSELPVQLPIGTPVEIHCNETCFYAEQGGQIGDTGFIETLAGDYWKVEVEDTLSTAGGRIVVHKGRVVAGSPEFPSLHGETSLRLVVDDQRRTLIMRNHTSTHMLNWALREVLGDHVQQKGSLVDPEKTRFDFSHNKPLIDDELARVEQLVNEMIQKDLLVYTQEVPLEDARKIKTVRAVFGEKYADPVRVVSVGGDIKAMLGRPDDPEWMKYPVELCGGTHLKRSSEAERFVVILEEGVAKGVRRVVGITADAARQAEATGQDLLAEATALASGTGENHPPHPPLSKGGSSGAAAPIPSRDPGAPGPVAPGDHALADQPPVAPGDATHPPHPPLSKGGSSGAAALIPSRDREGADTEQSPERKRRAAPDREGAEDEPDAGHPPHPPLSKGGRGGVKPARTSADLSTQVTAFQQKVNDAVIPILVRRELQRRITELQKKAKAEEKKAASATSDAVLDQVASLLESAEVVNDVKIVVGQVPPADPAALRSAIDWVRNKTDASAVLLASVKDNKVTLIAGMSKAVVKKGVKAGDLIKEIAPLVGGRGGGRPDMAQGGGTDPNGLPDALAQARAWIKENLG